ncbi:MAG: XRE family transcriptional regulator [Isosphaeraceae bacterium]|nr:XRE family transcriptional regulator [Isosphaeraceae bacterium]
MARRKNRPESVRVKCHLSERLRMIRTELYGERGGSEMARRLGLPIRTWYNYEAGVTVPAEVLLRFLELTSVEPLWLLYGKGPKYRVAPPMGAETGLASVEELLRAALERLGQREAAGPRLPVRPATAHPEDPSFWSGVVLMRVEGREMESLTDTSGPRFLAAKREWLAAERECRCVRIEGEAMAPIAHDGACVAFADEEDHPDLLEGRLVVAWVEDRPLVRWFNRSGRFGVLRAENPAHEPSTLLVDLNAPPRERRLRRVLWICTPHP